ncbi:MAG: Ig-like domain-containing protein, partial [Pirellulaceae bacterium]
PIAEEKGHSTITVTVKDAGPDGDLNTVMDNLTTSITFVVFVDLLNTDPTLAALGSVNLAEDAPEQVLALTGITDGDDGEQPLRVTASSNNTSLIADPVVTYTTDQETGSLKYTPLADQSGTAIITVTVEDGGDDKDLGTTDDNATFSRTFTVTVDPVNDVPVSGDTSFAPEENKVINVSAENGLLALSSDVENDPLTFTIVTSTAYGQLTTQANGAFSYEPNEGFNRSDFLEYRVNDGTVDGNLARIDFHIDTQRAWYNCLKPLDVNDDTFTTPLDALWIINSLNADGARQLVNARTKPLEPPFYDVNKDGFAAPLDALVVINYLNMAAGEGEADATSNPLFDYFAGNTYQPLPLSRSQSPTTLPSAASPLPLTDDAYRTSTAATLATDPAAQPGDGQDWQAAVDQLLEEDLDCLWDNDILPPLR